MLQERCDPVDVLKRQVIDSLSHGDQIPHHQLVERFSSKTSQKSAGRTTGIARLEQQRPIAPERSPKRGFTRSGCVEQDTGQEPPDT